MYNSMNPFCAKVWFNVSDTQLGRLDSVSKDNLLNLGLKLVLQIWKSGKISIRGQDVIPGKLSLTNNRETVEPKYLTYVSAL